MVLWPRRRDGDVWRDAAVRGQQPVGDEPVIWAGSLSQISLWVPDNVLNLL